MLGIDEGIDMGFPDRSFESFIYDKIDVLVIGVQYCINYGVGLCVAGWLGTGFDRDAYGLTLGIYEVIELCFSNIYFES